MNNIDAQQLIQQMQSLVNEAKGPAVESAPDGAGFSSAFKNAIDTVNTYQQEASTLATKFEQGDPSVKLSDVMVSLQKSSVSFQAMSQVRNHVVSAYQDIMNMPI